jgi:hypothetical protein
MTARKGTARARQMALKREMVAEIENCAPTSRRRQRLWRMAKSTGSGARGFGGGSTN